LPLDHVTVHAKLVAGLVQQRQQLPDRAVATLDRWLVDPEKRSPAENGLLGSRRAGPCRHHRLARKEPRSLASTIVTLDQKTGVPIPSAARDQHVAQHLIISLEMMMREIFTDARLCSQLHLCCDRVPRHCDTLVGKPPGQS
jgi:hypothetical protein